ncbi:MAG TPA: potassium-transporting ATPase subunit KdpC [Actinomycetales bacterium]
MPSLLRQHLAALRALLVLTVLLGLLYPLLVTGVAQLVAGDRADGQLLRRDGVVVGSALIGQSFTDSAGTALPQYFQSRPSAAGDGYDGASSSASNLGPNDAGLLETVTQRRAEVAQREGVTPAQVPADAVTASGSGLDPQISPQYARIQVARVAATRGLTEQQVQRLVAEHSSGRDLGFIGAPHVDVLALNLALDAIGGPS